MRTLNLPRVTVTDDYNDREVASFYGPHAESWAAHFVDKLPDVREGRYGFSVSDDGCVNCGQLFSGEARTPLGNDLWGCPSCGCTTPATDHLVSGDRTQ
jgi:hypothetical protein